MTDDLVSPSDDIPPQGVAEGFTAIERQSGAPVEIPTPADGYMPRGFAQLHGLRQLTPAERAVARDPDAWTTAPLTGLVKVAEVQDSVIFAEQTDPEPRCPKTGCALTHPHLHTDAEMGRPFKHNGITTEPHRCKQTNKHTPHLWRPNPQSEHFTCFGQPLVMSCPRCGFGTQYDDKIWDHLAQQHDWNPERIERYMNDPAFADAEDVCDHPNGFGPNGCACGTPAPSEAEDDPKKAPEEVKLGNTENGECSVCHAKSVRVSGDMEIWWHEGGNSNGVCKSQGAVFVPEDGTPCPVGCGTFVVKGEHQVMRHHLQADHGWTGDMWEDWAERASHASPIPDPLAKALAFTSANSELARVFFDPQIPDQEAIQLMGLEPDKPATPRASEFEQALTSWWLDRASEEARTVVPKAIEYGSNSLMEQGRRMAKLQGRTVSDDEALELGCWDYAAGKMERWTDAVLRGDRPSEDTLYDIGIYVKMAQRIRDVGSWPGVPTNN